MILNFGYSDKYNQSLCEVTINFIKNQLIVKLLDGDDEPIISNNFHYEEIEDFLNFYLNKIIKRKEEIEFRINITKPTIFRITDGVKIINPMSDNFKEKRLDELKIIENEITFINEYKMNNESN